MQDRKCLRCQSEMKELPTPLEQAGLGTTIKTYACPDCGEMSFVMPRKTIKRVMEVKNANNTE